MAKRKGNNYKFWHSPIALIILFCLVIFFSYKIIDLIRKDKETAHKKELILEQIDSLRQREFTLSKDITKLETQEGQEEIIREKYQVAKPNEKMVIIVDEEQKSNNLIEEEKTSRGFGNWVKGIFDR